MIKLFKRKSEKEKLQKKYHRLLAEAHKLSTVDRMASDQKKAEAEEISKKIALMP